MLDQNEGLNNKSLKLERLSSGQPLRVLDLFSGCGGLSLGFHRAGFKIVGGIENDPGAVRTHGLNFFSHHPPDGPHFQPVDITITTPENYLRQVLEADRPDNLVDLVIGGPPCQAFARIGRAKLREILNHPQAFLNDRRATFYTYFLEYVEYFRPLAVLIENVSDILNYGGKNVAEEIVASLEDMGYHCRYTLLNSVNFGVPQYRVRFFLLAFLDSLQISPLFPDPTHYIEIPDGYRSTIQVSLKQINGNQLNLFNHNLRYINPAEPPSDLAPAITARQAIEDLPEIKSSSMTGGSGQVRRFDQQLPYETILKLSDYARQMRTWPGFEAADGVSDQVTRYLPRDFAIFRQMKPGDQYPEAHQIASQLFADRLAELQRENPGLYLKDSPEYQALEKSIVPPYSVDKFPNKWWKINPDQPIRTLTAHIGKDTYTHIHYDSDQARTITVREAARLQSFPDGFKFAGAMNPAFRQIGNSVPPLLAYALARQIKALLTAAR